MNGKRRSAKGALIIAVLVIAVSAGIFLVLREIQYRKVMSRVSPLPDVLNAASLGDELERFDRYSSPGYRNIREIQTYHRFQCACVYDKADIESLCDILADIPEGYSGDCADVLNTVREQHRRVLTEYRKYKERYPFEEQSPYAFTIDMYESSTHIIEPYTRKDTDISYPDGINVHIQEYIWKEDGKVIYMWVRIYSGSAGVNALYSVKEPMRKYEWDRLHPKTEENTSRRTGRKTGGSNTYSDSTYEDAFEDFLDSYGDEFDSIDEAEAYFDDEFEDPSEFYSYEFGD